MCVLVQIGDACSGPLLTICTLVGYAFNDGDIGLPFAEAAAAVVGAVAA